MLWLFFCVITLDVFQQSRFAWNVENVSDKWLSDKTHCSKDIEFFLRIAFVIWSSDKVTVLYWNAPLKAEILFSMVNLFLAHVLPFYMRRSAFLYDQKRYDYQLEQKKKKRKKKK